MKSFLQAKKGQTGGLVSGLIFGIAGLVIGVIIAFVIVSTLTSSNLLGTGTAENLTVFNMKANLTSGVDAVSSKLPTALLVAAIVLILSILGVLVGVWQKMRVGGGSI